MPYSPEELFPDLSDDAIIASASAALGQTLPDACVPGVIQNSRLLRQHWLTLLEAVPPASDETRA